VGYRTYIGKVPKSEPLPTDAFENNIQMLVELGKYVEWRPEEKDQDPDEDQELYYIGRNFMIRLIEEYEANNRAWFDQIWELYEANPGDPAIKSYLRKLKREWTNNLYGIKGCTAITKDEINHAEITNSNSYEYSIFNLLHVLHSTDYENEQLIYYCR
jgi:hypothetical protein